VALPPRESTSIAQRLSWGAFSRPASGKANEDFYALRLPDVSPGGRREIAIALADGMSSDGSSRPVTEATVLGLISDYYATSRAVERRADAGSSAARGHDWVWGAQPRHAGREAVTSAISLLGHAGSHATTSRTSGIRAFIDSVRGGCGNLTVDHVGCGATFGTCCGGRSASTRIWWSTSRWGTRGR
jgi:hypothetical protein